MADNSLTQHLLSDSNWDEEFTSTQIPLTAVNTFTHTQAPASFHSISLQQPTIANNFNGNTLSPWEYPLGFVNTGFNQIMSVMNAKNNPSIGNTTGNIPNNLINNISMNQNGSIINQSNLFNDDGTSGYSFTIEEIDFKDEYCKIQSRVQKGKCQRINNGDIKFFIVFSKPINKESFSLIQVKLHRTKESKMDQEKHYGGDVLLKIEKSFIDGNYKICVHLDLDSVFETYGSEDYKKIYALDRSNRDLNQFHLSVEVHFRNGQLFVTNTKCFQIFGKDPAKRTRVGRPYSVSASSTDSCHGYGTSEEGSPDAKRLLTGDIHAHQVFADYIKTKNLRVEGRLEAIVSQSTNGDIAYHFKLKDSTEKFEEGEIVGFVVSTYDDRLLVVEKLSDENAVKATLKGVVTRSQYFEAHFPKDDTPTETIAVSGIVPVKVKGPVGPNEALYASFDSPGVAVGEKNFEGKDVSKASYIGYSVNGSSENADKSSISLVQAIVSIYQTASLMKINDRLSFMNSEMEENFYRIDKEQRKRKRVCIGVSIAVSIFLLLLGIFLWQYFVPGTAFRYYKCKIGRKVPHGSATYHFIPKNNIYWYPQVNGIEYEYDKLLASMHKTHYKPISNFYNSTGFRFYKNIDRCAYARVSSTSDIMTGAKEVAGADIFAVDSKCFYAYYYSEASQRWIKYLSVSWPKRNNIFCKPKSKYKKAKKGDPLS